MWLDDQFITLCLIHPSRQLARVAKDEKNIRKKLFRRLLGLNFTFFHSLRDLYDMAVLKPWARLFALLAGVLVRALSEEEIKSIAVWIHAFEV